MNDVFDKLTIATNESFDREWAEIMAIRNREIDARSKLIEDARGEMRTRFQLWEEGAPLARGLPNVADGPGVAGSTVTADPQAAELEAHMNEIAKIGGRVQ